jgi:hypothetical protein
MVAEHIVLSSRHCVRVSVRFLLVFDICTEGRGLENAPFSCAKHKLWKQNTWSDKSRGMHQFPSSFSAVNLILHSCYFCAAIRCWMMLHGLFDCTQVTSESGMFCWMEFLLHLQPKHPSKDEFLVAKCFKTRLPYLQVHFNSSVNLLFSILCLQQCSNIVLTESHNRNGESGTSYQGGSSCAPKRPWGGSAGSEIQPWWKVLSELWQGVHSLSVGRVGTN